VIVELDHLSRRHVDRRIGQTDVVLAVGLDAARNLIDTRR
jgi:hypothetical protein